MTTARALDRKVHRCSACGGWCYRGRPCTLCGRLGAPQDPGGELLGGRGCAVCGAALRRRDDGELCPSCRDQLAIPW